MKLDLPTGLWPFSGESCERGRPGVFDGGLLNVGDAPDCGIYAAIDVPRAQQSRPLLSFDSCFAHETRLAHQVCAKSARRSVIEFDPIVTISRRRARASRDITVPIGTCVASAISR
jgi:hypothetical protein